MQALYLLGLDPIGETQADTNSYGFRLHRSCADALGQCHRLLCQGNCPCWVLEGDIQACFDQISHTWLLAHVPMDREVLRQWLKADYLERNVFFATTDGTPQGGIASPALANRALDGLQQRLADRFGATQSQRQRNRVHLVRNADDLLITGTGGFVAVRISLATWSYSRRTVTVNCTAKALATQALRPARDVCKGLSCMRGNLPVQF
jgi:RNA-directed DNA polymerase